MGLNCMEEMKGGGVVLYIDIFLSLMRAIIRMAYVQRGMIRELNKPLMMSRVFVISGKIKVEVSIISRDEGRG